MPRFITKKVVGVLSGERELTPEEKELDATINPPSVAELQ